jgi:glyoxylase-like metal-dependent hydrolase (beta-lactamase superfamily II)/rhodanese-related sulfurtransferase
MYFEQFYLTCLSHASYMIGSEGVAAVIDPQRDVDLYLEEARRNNLRIEHVIETHLHADFVSGHQELSAATGARIYLGALAGARFTHTAVHNGDSVCVGRCRLEFLETPGHTLESISVLVTYLDRSPEPFAVLTGDTLFIGDVGRPDLSGDCTPQQLAGLLYDSLHQKLLRLPDNVEVYPAHGAGSLCGRNMSSERRSTIGKERVSNYALRAATRDDFIHLVTAELPERPGYFSQDVELNRAGATPLAELPPIPALAPREVVELAANGAVVLDTRPPLEFAAAHIPGSIHIALAGQFASWAGIVLGLDKELMLVGEDEEKVHEARARLARVGIERVAGYLAGGIGDWTAEGMSVEQVPQISVAELHDLLEHDPAAMQVVDVRRAGEWKDGHIASAMLKPLDHLESDLGELDRRQAIAVHCKSGYRSSIAASLLERAGFKDVHNVTGGFDAWRTCGLPVAQ